MTLADSGDKMSHQEQKYAGKIAAQVPEQSLQNVYINLRYVCYEQSVEKCLPIYE